MAQSNGDQQFPAGKEETFEQWTVNRSFAMIERICKLTLLILLPLLLVADPVFFVNGFWTRNPQYFYLAIWHVVLSMGYLCILIASKFIRTDRAKSRVLAAFMVFSACVFSWFGVISWFITGDFSTYGVVMICMAAIFCCPGNLRRYLYVGTAFGMSVVIALMDEKGTFLGSAVFLHLIVIVIVALAVDHYMMKNSRSHFNALRSSSSGVSPSAEN